MCGQPPRDFRTFAIATVVGILVSIAAAYTARGFPNIFDYWALVSTIFVAAPFASFLLGVFTRRIGGTAAFCGMLSGILGTLTHYVLYRFGYLHYGSDLDMDFYGGFYGFPTNLVVAALLSIFERPRPLQQLQGLVCWDTPSPSRAATPFYRTPEALALGAVALVIVLNIIFW